MAKQTCPPHVTGGLRRDEVQITKHRTRITETITCRHCGDDIGRPRSWEEWR